MSSMEKKPQRGVDRLPAYPLFVNDPYFSLWSAADELNGAAPVFWHGEEKPMLGKVCVDGKAYTFLGKGENPLPQTSVRISAFSTDYTFECERFELKVSFLSPLLPTDLSLASRPVCYLRYALTPKADIKEATVRFSVEERIAYNTCFDEARKETVNVCRFSLNGFACASVGLLRQYPMSHSSDEFGADWGYWYVAGESAGWYEEETRRWIYAENGAKNAVKGVALQGKFLLAFNDLCSINYYGEWLKGYYYSSGKTVFEAMQEAWLGEDEALAKCKAFDDDLSKRCEAYGEEYLFVLRAALRQTMGAHKLVEDSKKRLLWLSKECNSDGCIATVDVTYPSAPLFLLYAPELVRGMLRPIFDFARMPVWNNDFAPHDAGIYPYCCGQLYAVKAEHPNGEVYVREWKQQESLAPFYTFPASFELYDDERQMPVEECGNMLILSALVYNEELSEHLDLFKKWADYLVAHGLIPENQLCTDDFTGHLDKNANLAIKAICGIAAFAKILESSGKTEEGKLYREKAEAYALEWKRLYTAADGHTVLALGNEASYSMKYNLTADTLLGTGLFADIAEKEVADCLARANAYGIPLDNRSDSAKTDWHGWLAASTSDREKQKKIFAYLCKFLAETPDRVPFSDWYSCEKGTYSTFRNRTVQGGLFALLYRDELNKTCE
ncbi:MAG: DUF4965 domain-containing protein [Clostridia bacterium]|nr:DUF4965 domain-containing protein [Clostridia bacterium]